MKTVKFEGWLTVASPPTKTHMKGSRGAVARLTVGKPSTGKSEVALKLVVTLPAVLFDRPTLEARITVTEPGAPTVIQQDVIDASSQVLRDTTGFDIQILPPEEQK